MARVSLLLLLAAALLVHQLLHGAAGSPVQLELLRFLNPQAPTLSRLAAAAASQQRQAPPAAQQPAGAGRSLLQDGDGPTFVEGPGNTLDGFDFGFGGILPIGGAFNGFGFTLYNFLFSDILNNGLNNYIAQSLSNSGGVNPLDFIDPEFTKPWRRNVVALYGFDYYDRWLGSYLSRAKAEAGDLVEPGCVGPTYSLTVDGGSCELLDDGGVECSPPSVKLQGTPLTCNLPYRAAASLSGEGWQYKVEFGRKRSGSIGGPAGLYNYGASLNATVPYLGLSLQTRRLANDFGVQQWYQYVGQLVLNELVRIQAALLSGSVDSKILTRQAQQRADAVAAAEDGAGAGGAARISDGLAAAAAAQQQLMTKVAARMNMTVSQLEAGLRAAGALPQQGAQKQQRAAAAAAGAADAANAVAPGAGGGSAAAPQEPVSITSSVVQTDAETNSNALMAQLDSRLSQLSKAAEQQLGVKPVTPNSQQATP